LISRFLVVLDATVLTCFLYLGSSVVIDFASAEGKAAFDLLRSCIKEDVRAEIKAGVREAVS
jgi:hypothetical protein